jgi:hypothetical protein
MTNRFVDRGRMGLRYKKAPAIEVYFGIKKLPYTLG